MNEVKETKYLGDIIQSNGHNNSNIKNRTNKAHGNVNKIITSLKERHYGKHYFKAAMLMRQRMLVGGMLTNSECWINLTKKDIEDLEKPDIILQRKVLSVQGNPSTCFMQLELGIIPVRFVVKQKRLNFLHYILNESMESLVKQVYIALKEDSRKGDFVSLINADKKDFEIELTDEEIEVVPRHTWKQFIKKKVKQLALKSLTEENNNKEKTRHVDFGELKISEYLVLNKRTSLSKLMFSVRSKTLNIKEWQSWLYKDDTRVACEKTCETMNHFMHCNSYKSEAFSDWNDILGNDTDKQISAGLAIEKRFSEREDIMMRMVEPRTSTPQLQETVELCYNY